MNKEKSEVIKDLQNLLSEKKVLTDEASCRNADTWNRGYEKAFEVYLTPPALAIVMAENKEDLVKTLKYCNEHGVSVIPRTGGSGGEGLLEVVNDSTIVLDASQMDKLISFDPENMMVTAECGMPLERLEEEILNPKGYTTGHAPQSLPMADLGGLVATRSIGQFSTYFGAIEDMLCGLKGLLPNGEEIEIRNVPRRAAGPDLRHLFMGSEGALGFITEVTLKLQPYYPDSRWLGGYIVHDIMTGFDAIREIMREGYKPSVVRLYDKADYDYNYKSQELKDDEAFMFFVTDGPPEIAKATGEAIDRIAKEHGARWIGTKGVEHWMIHRNDLCEGYVHEKRSAKFRSQKAYYATTEIAANWSEIKEIYNDVMANVPGQFEDVLTVLGGHVSHSYINGTNIYFVYEYKVPQPELADKLHRQIINAICEEVIKYPTGGVVHHHGMGKRRVNFAAREHGSSYQLMKGLKKMMDPNGIMNPGTLVELEK
ncbi:MAG: FAD-binding oxidoreductase [Eubacteriales bacterium]|nr:FAD-binding oxidoreductase [Eubacteriales bacterium]